MNHIELIQAAIVSLTDEVRDGRAENRADLAALWQRVDELRDNVHRQDITLARIAEQLQPAQVGAIKKHAPGVMAGVSGSAVLLGLLELLPSLAPLFR